MKFIAQIYLTVANCLMLISRVLIEINIIIGKIVDKMGNGIDNALDKAESIALLRMRSK